MRTQGRGIDPWDPLPGSPELVWLGLRPAKGRCFLDVSYYSGVEGRPTAAAPVPVAFGFQLSPCVCSACCLCVLRNQIPCFLIIGPEGDFTSGRLVRRPREHFCGHCNDLSSFAQKLKAAQGATNSLGMHTPPSLALLPHSSDSSAGGGDAGLSRTCDFLGSLRVHPGSYDQVQNFF